MIGRVWEAALEFAFLDHRPQMAIHEIPDFAIEVMAQPGTGSPVVQTERDNRLTQLLLAWP
jgi:hypothetical protein